MPSVSFLRFALVPGLSCLVRSGRPNERRAAALVARVVFFVLGLALLGVRVIDLGEALALQELLDGLVGDGQAQMSFAGDGPRNADELALLVEERAAGVAEEQSTVELQERDLTAVGPAHLDETVGRADDAASHRRVQAPRIADGRGHVTALHALAVVDDGAAVIRDVIGPNLQQSQVALPPVADDAALPADRADVAVVSVLALRQPHVPALLHRPLLHDTVLDELAFDEAVVVGDAVVVRENQPVLERDERAGAAAADDHVGLIDQVIEVAGLHRFGHSEGSDSQHGRGGQGGESHDALLSEHIVPENAQDEHCPRQEICDAERRGEPAVHDWRFDCPMQYTEQNQARSFSLQSMSFLCRTTWQYAHLIRSAPRHCPATSSSPSGRRTCASSAACR